MNLLDFICQILFLFLPAVSSFTSSDVQRNDLKWTGLTHKDPSIQNKGGVESRKMSLNTPKIVKLKRNFPSLGNNVSELKEEASLDKNTGIPIAVTIGPGETIFMVNKDGRTVVAGTENGAKKQKVAGSPDGRSISTTKTSVKHSNLVVMSTNGPNKVISSSEVGKFSDQEELTHKISVKEMLKKMIKQHENRIKKLANMTAKSFDDYDSLNGNSQLDPLKFLGITNAPITMRPVSDDMEFTPFGE